MTEKEKAKAYDNVVRRIKDFIKRWDGIKLSSDDLFTDELKEIFPELQEQESEDERIRKAILDHLTIMWGNSQDDVCGVHVEDAIAWLEKQDEKPQVDGFDAELNALLKKYEHLQKNDIVECMEFYLNIIKNK